MINMIVAAVAKVVLNWVLTALPYLGIMGAAWATVADIGIAAVVNLYFIHRYTGYRVEMLQFIKTVGSAGIMALAVKGFYDAVMLYLGSNVIATFGAVFVGCAVYLVVLFMIGGIMEEDLERIPLLGKFSSRMLCKIGVFKK